MLLWSCVECSRIVSAAGWVVIYGGEVRESCSECMSGAELRFCSGRHLLVSYSR